MDLNSSNKVALWAGVGGSEAGIGAEIMAVAYDLRSMILCSIVLIATDFWWGHSESMQRYEEAKANGDTIGMEQYKWRKSRAIRRTTNKFVDYMTYLLVGAYLGIAITEPMGWGYHMYTAAGALGIGCLAEIASILGHYCYLKLGIEVKTKDVWRWLIRFIVNILTLRGMLIGKAADQTINDKTNKDY